MDLIKIGKYIASKRKALGLTQVQLAEKLGMSDKSVSKWERGICLPDVSVYMELCQILGISLNEFIAGEDLQQENVIAQSEENLLQITKDGQLKKRRLWILIGVLTCLLAAAVGIFLFHWLRDRGNYVEPVDRNSAQGQMAALLAGEDGAYLYQYHMDDPFAEMKVILNVYKKGELERTEDIAVFGPGPDAAQEGIAAIIPDFDQFKIRLIIAENGAKYSTEFDILENVPEREYYGRSATEITGRTRITENHEQDIVAFLYGRYGVRVPAIENIMEEETALSNDYTYKLSFRFGNGS